MGAELNTVYSNAKVFFFNPNSSYKESVIGSTSNTYAPVGSRQMSHQSHGSEIKHTMKETWCGLATAGSLRRSEVDIVDFLSSWVEEAKISFELLPGL